MATERETVATTNDSPLAAPETNLLGTDVALHAHTDAVRADQLSTLVANLKTPSALDSTNVSVYANFEERILDATSDTLGVQMRATVPHLLQITSQNARPLPPTLAQLQRGDPTLNEARFDPIPSMAPAREFYNTPATAWYVRAKSNMPELPLFVDPFGPLSQDVIGAGFDFFSAIVGSQANYDAYDTEGVGRYLINATMNAYFAASRLPAFALVREKTMLQNRLKWLKIESASERTYGELDDVPIDTDPIKSATDGVGRKAELNPAVSSDSLLVAHTRDTHYQVISAFARWNKTIPNDDYEEYPHVPEILAASHRYEWVLTHARERIGMWNTNYGPTTGVMISVAGGKAAELVYMNTDALTDRMNTNALRTAQTMKRDVPAILETIETMKASTNNVQNYGRNNVVVTKDYTVAVVDPASSRIYLGGDGINDAMVAAYETGFALSESIRYNVYTALYRRAIDLLGANTVISDGMGMTAGFTSTRNATTQTGSGSAPSAYLTELARLTMTSSVSDIAHMLIQDMMSSYIDARAHEYMIGDLNPYKFSLAMLSVKIAFMLQPNLWWRHRQAKSLAVYQLLRTFYPASISALMGEIGFGVYNDDSEAIGFEHLRDYRLDCTVKRFPLLHPNDWPVGTSRDRRSMRDLVNWLLDDRVAAAAPVVIRAGGYRRTGRVATAPGVWVLNGGEENVSTYAAATMLSRLTELRRTWASLPDVSVRIRRNASQPYETYCSLLETKYVLSFTQWFHETYCMAAHILMSTPLLTESVLLDPGDNWNEVGTLVDNDAVARAEYGMRIVMIDHIAITLPRSGTFSLPQFELVTHVLLAYHVNHATVYGGEERHSTGARAAEPVLQLLRGLDYLDMFREFEGFVRVSARICENIQLLARIMSNRLVEIPSVQIAFDRFLKIGSRMTVSSAVNLLRMLGTSLGGDGAVRRLDTGIAGLLERDPRIFAPSVMRRRLGELVPGSLRPLPRYARDHVFENGRLLTSMLFDDTYGLRALTTGFIADARRLATPLSFNSVHAMPCVGLKVSSNALISTDPNTLRTSSRRKYMFFSIETGRELETREYGDGDIEGIRRHIETRYGTVAVLVPTEPRVRRMYLDRGYIDSHVGQTQFEIEYALHVRRVVAFVFPDAKVIRFFAYAHEDDLSRPAEAPRELIKRARNITGTLITTGTSVSTRNEIGTATVDGVYYPILPNGARQVPAIVAEYIDRVQRESVNPLGRISSFFPPISEIGARGESYVWFGGQMRALYDVYKFALRTPQMVYYLDPTTDHSSAVRESLLQSVPGGEVRQ